MDYFYTFVYSYPIFMTFLWITGAIIFFLRREWKKPDTDSPPQLDTYPPVSILIPCHNEEDTIRDTLEVLDKQDYPEYEVIAVNDGSTDNTERMLTKLTLKYKWLRVINLHENRGKATALNIGILSSKNEFLICIDADALLDPSAINWMMYHFVNWPVVGAVTGNPRIRNRTRLLSKIQVGEFSAIVGMIKRCQRIIGKLFTVSGVIAGFRKSALIQVGLLDTDTVTEDIDISWKLQTNFWDIRFEPRAICRILMPETYKGLWKQRLRWAQGGMEVMLKNIWIWTKWRQHRLFAVFADYVLSVLWVYSALFAVLFWITGFFLNLLGWWYWDKSLLASWNGVIIGTVCMMQFMLGIFLDNCYEKGTGRYYYWAIWYPLVYWIIIILTVAVGVPKAIFKKRVKFATWDSPDRGLNVYESYYS